MGDREKRGQSQNNRQAIDTAARLRSAKQYKTFMRRLHRAIYAKARRLRLLPAPSSPDQPLIVVRDPEEVLEQHFAKTWAWAVKHSVFRVLKDDPNFERAWISFQGRAARWDEPRDPRAACRFVYLVALWIGIHSTPHLRETLIPRDAKGMRVRTDKQRAKARRHIELVQGHLAARTTEPHESSDRALLARLLEKWKRELAVPRPKPFLEPELFALACMLLKEHGSADAKLLMDVATAVGLDCEERTAQRYLKAARGSAA